MSLQGSRDEPAISLAYLPPTSRQTRFALAGAAGLLLGLVVLIPFAALPLPRVDGFITAVDAIISVTDLITAGLLLAHFSITGSRALWALGSGYLFSATIIVIHGLTFPGVISPTGNLGGSLHTNFRIYLLWHLGLPLALFAYVWLRDKDRAKAGASTSLEIVATCGGVGVLAIVSCIAWLALLPPLAPIEGRWLTVVIMSICAAALSVLWFFRRSALDQWLMVVVLAMIVELAITALIGGRGPSSGSLGFYTGRLFSLVTSTVVLLALLAETTRLYAGVARADVLARIVNASRALSGEIVMPKLIERLMKIAIESARADRGLLILPSEDEYLVQAEARANGDQIEVTMHQEPITLINCPEALVRHVIRTCERVILDEASRPNLFFGDDYLRDRQAKSILCLPLIKQGELAGVLLLESTSTSHAFTPARIAVLELLAAQAAISLENTRLYSDLQERESKVRRLVDSNIIGICIFNLDRRIVEANDAFLSIVGHSRDDVSSGRLSFADLTPPEWAEGDERRLAELVSTGTWRPCEKEFFRKDGSRISVFAGGAAFGGLRRQGVAFVVDLSERKRSEEALRRAQADLAHVSRITTLGEMTASIAHEVNQPLGSVVNNANACLTNLSNGSPDIEEVRQALTDIIEGADRASAVISRVRNLSKKVPYENAPVDLNHVVSEVISLVKHEAAARQVEIHINTAGDLPTVRGDRVQLQQVLLNLVVNGMDAMRTTESSKRIVVISGQVELRGEKPWCLMGVQDGGIGFKPGEPDRLFEAFYTTKSEGMGMGLAISRSIVEAHGGHLWVDIEHGPGAKFLFRLPAEGGTNP